MMNGPQRPLAGLAGLTFLLIVTFLSTSRYEMSATITEGIAILFVAVLLYLGYVTVRCRMSPPVLSEDGPVTDP